MANIIKFVSEIFDVNFDITKNMENLKKKCEKIKIDVKENDNFFMLSFYTGSDINDPVVREANGAIFSKKDFKILHHSFEKCHEGLSSETTTSGEDIFLLSKTSDVYYSIELYFEGSIIKAFNYDGNWHWATSRCFDASKVNWKTKRNFLELFEESVVNSENVDLATFENTFMSPEFMYTFLMQHPEIHTQDNKTSVPLMWGVNQIHRESLEFKALNKGMVVLEKTKDTDKVLDFLMKRDTKTSYILNVHHLRDSDEIVKRVKILNNTLKRKNALGGRFQDTCIGYMKYAGNHEAIEMHEFRDLFPEHEKDFDRVDQLFFETVKKIHKLYLETHVVKNNTNSDDKENEKYSRTVYQLHSQYKRTRKPITHEDVSQKLRTLNEYVLAGLIGYKK